MKAGVEPGRIEPIAPVSALRRQFHFDDVGVDSSGSREMAIRRAELKAALGGDRIKRLALNAVFKLDGSGPVVAGSALVDDRAARMQRERRRIEPRTTHNFEGRRSARKYGKEFLSTRRL